MEKLVRSLVTPLIDHPDEMKIDVETSDNSISVTIHVINEDMGQIIGKHGRIANALRTVLKAVGARNHKKVYVEIVE